MGADIHGWVEVWLDAIEEWSGVVDIGVLAYRHYGVFGKLFGVRNDIGFAPVAPSRGLPADASVEARQAFNEISYHSASWICWSEIKSIDPDASIAENRIAIQRRDEAGRWIPSDRWLHAKHPNAEAGMLEWEEDGRRFVVERITWDGILNDYPSWQALFHIMATLAELYGDNGIRLVVWFDS